MNSFKIDPHVHTSETSPCGKVPGVEVSRIYAEGKYDGIVITDHYYEGYFDTLEGLSWDEKIDAYLSGYKLAKEEGDRLGLRVFMGIELRFLENLNDYLIFGIDEDFLRQFPRLYNMNLASFRELSLLKNLLVYQAHPFRVNMVRANPELLDGIEVYNGNPRQISSNDLALRYAKDHDLLMISGSDFHRPEDLGTGGVIFDGEINNNKELVHALKENRIKKLIENLVQ